MGGLNRTSASEKYEIIRMVEDSALPVKQTLNEIGVSRSTFYRWYEQYQRDGTEGLQDQSSQPRQFWNRIPETVRDRVVQIALDRVPGTVATRAGMAYHGHRRLLHFRVECLSYPQGV